jgi:hypothetical protein
MTLALESLSCSTWVIQSGYWVIGLGFLGLSHSAQCIDLLMPGTLFAFVGKLLLTPKDHFTWQNLFKYPDAPP